MKLSVLASGSKGNSCFVETEKKCFLIDLGTTSLYVEKQLKTLDKTGKDIAGIFLTHSHADHVNGLSVFIKKYNPTIYLTEKIYNELLPTVTLTNVNFIDKEVLLDDVVISVIPTSHDTDDSVGYVFEENDHSFVYITDTGYINVKNHKKLINKNVYVLESNHDVEMLMNNPHYPYQIKQRILGDKGHLSNEDSAYYLTRFIGDNTKTIILAHLSEQNNTEQIALDTLNNTFKEYDKHCDTVLIATQKERTELVEV